MSLQDFKQQYPAYKDIPDGQLAESLHRKYYPGMAFDEFAGKIGLSQPESEPAEPEPMPQGSSFLSYSNRPQPSGILGTLPGDIPKITRKTETPIIEPEPQTTKDINEIGFDSPLLGGEGTQDQRKPKREPLNIAAESAYSAVNNMVNAIEPFFMTPAEERAMRARHPNLMAARYAAASLLLPGVSEKLASPEELEAFISQPKEEQQKEILGLAAAYAVFGAGGKGAKALLNAAAKRYPVLTAKDWWAGLFGEKAGKYGPQWLRRMTNKERGLMVQNLDEAVSGMKAKGMSEGEIFREIKKTFGNEAAYRRFAEQQGLKAKEAPRPEPATTERPAPEPTAKEPAPTPAAAERQPPAAQMEQITQRPVQKPIPPGEPAALPPRETPEEHTEDIKIKPGPGASKNKTVSVDIPEPQAEALTPKEQKKYFIDEIETALAKAPEFKGFQPDKPELSPREQTEQLIDKYGQVTIEIPGDGEYTVINTKKHLEELKKRSKSFPVSPKLPKRSGIPGTPKNRLKAFDGEYYNPYQHRKKSGVLEHPDKDAIYEHGFYSNHLYSVKIPKPKIKGQFEKGMGDQMKNLVAEFQKADIPVKIVGELSHIEETAEPMVDIVDPSGNHYLFDDKIIDNIMTHHPNAEPFILKENKEGLSPVAFKVDGELVAVAAPKMKTGLSGYHLKRYEQLTGAASEKKATPGGFASETGYASDADMGFADTGKHSTGGDMPSVLDLPEIVELAKQLTEGRIPSIKRKLSKKTAAGLFWPMGNGKIELRADIFENTELARKVLAHEIGHLVDYLPETMLRGNLLGRIASLKRHMKGKIPLDPKKPPEEMTKGRKAELLAEARKLAKEDANKLIDEEITRTLAVTPEDVLAIWNEAEPEKIVGKELIDFVKSLDTKAKKSIVKEALKGRTPAELERFTKTTMEKTGKQVKAGGYHKKLKKIYRHLIKKELRGRKYIHDAQIRDELKKFTHAWKPFDPANVKSSYLKYRYSGPELYADALSGMITNPAALKSIAPTFYDAWFNYLDNKPEVQRIFNEIQEDIARGPDALAEQRAERLKSGFREGSAARRKALKAMRKKDTHPIETILTYFDDKNSPVLIRAVRSIERQRNAAGELTEGAKQAIELRARLEELSNAATKIQVYTIDLRNRLFNALKDNKISASDLSYYLFQKRVIGDRFNIANPGGYYKDLSEKDLAIIQRKWGPEKTKQIQDLAKAFRDIREQEVLPLIERGGLIRPKLMERIWDTKDYVTFAVNKYLEGEHGPLRTAKVYQQFGTLQNVDNMILATIIKDIQMMRAAILNITKQQFELTNNKNGLGILERAEMRYSRDFKRQVPVDPTDPEKDLFVVFHEGEPVYYYAPTAVTEVFEYDLPRLRAGESIMRMLGTLPREIFVSKNPVFMARNPFRDFRETAKKLPEVRVRNAPELAKYYKEAFPEVVRYVFKHILSPDMREMAKAGMFPKSRMWGSTDPTTAGEIIDLIEETTIELDKTSADQYPEAVNVLKKVWDSLDKAGATSELISKVAAYKYMIKNAPNKSISQIGIDIRDKAGTPNFRQRGKLNYITNNLFPFSTVGKSGLKATYASFKDDPGAYIWKTMVFNLIPAMMRWGVRGGVALAIMQWLIDGGDDEAAPEQLQGAVNKLSDKQKEELKTWASKSIGSVRQLQRMYQGLSKYDMANYNIIPLYLREDGKTVYLRIPQDYEGQFISNLASRIMDKKLVGPKGALNALTQMNPYNLNPFIEQPKMWFDYFALGKSPVDGWTGETILTEQEKEAGGLYAAKRLARHTWDQIGGPVVYEPAWGRLETDRGPWEEFLSIMPGKVLGTFVKISDRGIAESIYEKIDQVRKQKAIESLEKKQAYIKLANGELKSLDEIALILTDDPAIQQQKLIRLLTQKSGNVYAKALANSNTKAEIMAILETMLETNYVQVPQ